ncbi:hypothetical protein [Streptomyces sp. NPDC002209]|uniref:hypothetical protein n=1 Tax=Streptomyces sp. NPDC002209 TaxID=3364638 RepID=UPI0036AB12A2
MDGVICIYRDRIQRADRDRGDFADTLVLGTIRRLSTPFGPRDPTEESETIKTGVMTVSNKAESLEKWRRIRD